MLNSDMTYLNIKGDMIVQGNTYIGKGCRIDVGVNAKVEFNRVFVNANCLFIISNGLIIGEGTIIGWNCHIIDEDFHTIHYEGKKESLKKISIGKHVWMKQTL